MPIVINLRPWDNISPDTVDIEFKVNGHAKPYTIVIKGKYQENTLNMTKEMAMELIKGWI